MINFFIGFSYGALMAAVFMRLMESNHYMHAVFTVAAFGISLYMAAR